MFARYKETCPGLNTSMVNLFQYCSNNFLGKISLLEFSELMEQENNSTAVEDSVETTVIDVIVENRDEDDVDTEVKDKQTEPGELQL